MGEQLRGRADGKSIRFSAGRKYDLTFQQVATLIHGQVSNDTSSIEYPRTSWRRDEEDLTGREASQRF